MSNQKGPVKRIKFLAKKFDVFDEQDIEDLVDKDFYIKNGDQYEQLYDINGDGESILYAIYTFNKRMLKNEGKKVPNNVRVADFVFIDIVQSDPTEHKEYVQWMLTTFTRLIKESEFERALMFVKEDLWMASEYLEVFHKQKHKPKFKALCAKNQAFKGISDPSNINQYRDLSQLYDAVDPYIDKNVSELERDLKIMSSLRYGDIPYEDRSVMVFNPTTIKSSRLFAKLTNWCTTSNKDSLTNYTNRKTASGKKSKLYVIIFKSYFLDDDNPKKTHELYQLHFESAMYMDRKDKRISDMSLLLEGNVGLQNFFYDLLIRQAKYCKNKQSNNYIEALMDFGFSDVIFDILTDDAINIRVNDYKVKELPNLTRLKKVKLLYMNGVGLEKLPSSIGGLGTLEVIALPDNRLEKLPKTISKLKKLKVLNLVGNRISSFPEEISQLDKANGGSLEILTIDDNLVDKAQRLLPSIKINEVKDIVDKQ